jgi:hemerythrin superfamily protein
MNPFKEFLNGFQAKTLENRTDVVSLIKADHRKVDKLFAQYVESKDSTEKENILKEIVSDLRVHAAAEESKVYPTLDREDHEGTNESLEEHHLIKILLEELTSNRMAEDKVDAKVRVLSEVVKHHVKEEETIYLPELQDSGADLEELGTSFISEKERLLGLPESGERIESTDDSDFMKVPDAVLEDEAVEVKRETAKKPPARKPAAKKEAVKKARVKKEPAKRVAAAKTIKAVKKDNTVKMPSAKPAKKKKAS